MFDLKRPCVNCPFKKGQGELFQLHPERLQGIVEANAFQCHRTIDYDPRGTQIKKLESLKRRFWSKVRKRLSGCWEWTAALDAYGYGVIGLGGRKDGIDKAHRVSWRLHFGFDPGDFMVLHSCDNRKCVNPDHLFLGNNAVNQLDAVSKGRRSNYRIVEDWEILQIRDEYVYNSREFGVNALSKKYGISSGHIHNIVTCKTVHYRDDGGHDQGKKPQQCAGLMSVLHREGKPNQIMQVGERLGAFKPDELVLDDAYGSIEEAFKAHSDKARN